MNRATFEVLNNALNKGIPSRVKYDTEDLKFIDQLKNNLAVFSSFKSYRQTNELITSLFDENGKQKSWNQFRKDAQAINKSYNSQWLQAEFNLAQRQARSAIQWKDFERDAAVYPNLEYMGSRAAKQRDSHKIWYGLIKPINDPFWDTAFPPNGWNCKCWVKQTDAQASDKIVSPPEEIKGISGNAGKTATIFSATHAYVSKLNKDEKKEVASEMKKQNIPSAEELSKRRIEFEAFGKEYEKTFFDDLTGGYVVTHKGHKFNEITGIQEKETVKLFAKIGRKIIFNDETLKDKKGNTLKAVDTTMDGLLTEIKCKNSIGFRTISNYLSDAISKGAKSLIITIYSENTISEISNEIGKKRTLKAKFESIYIVKGDQIKRL